MFGRRTAEMPSSRPAIRIEASPNQITVKLTPALKDLPCRAAAIYGERSHLTDPSAGPTVTAMNEGKVAAFTIPGTSHFPMIDSPFAFVSAIEGVALTWLAEWRRSLG